MRTVLSYLRPSAKKMAWGLTIKFLGTVMDLLLPWILAFVIDTVVPRRSLAQIALWGGVMWLCSVLAVVGNIAANRSAARIARDASERIRHDLFFKTAHLSCRQIDGFTVPSLEARLTTDTYNVHQMLNMMQRVGVRAPILLLGGVAVTLTLEPVLTLVLLSVLPLIALVVFFVSRKGVGLFSAMQRSVDALVRTVREDVTGIRIIKALSRTEGEKARFDGVNRAVSRRETAASTTMALSNPAINFFLGAGLTGVILVGAFRVDSGLTQPGTILAFLSYFTIILGAMLSITQMCIRDRAVPVHPKVFGAVGEVVAVDRLQLLHRDAAVHLDAVLGPGDGAVQVVIELPLQPVELGAAVFPLQLHLLSGDRLPPKEVVAPGAQLVQ